MKKSKILNKFLKIFLKKISIISIKNSIIYIEKIYKIMIIE